MPETRLLKTYLHILNESNFKIRCKCKQNGLVNGGRIIIMIISQLATRKRTFEPNQNESVLKKKYNLRKRPIKANITSTFFRALQSQKHLALNLKRSLNYFSNQNLVEQGNFPIEKTQKEQQQNFSQTFLFLFIYVDIKDKAFMPLFPYFI